MRAVSCSSRCDFSHGGIGPDDINLRQLIVRLQNEEVEELILATNPNIEGEATAMYVARLIKPSELK